MFTLSKLVIIITFLLHLLKFAQAARIPSQQNFETNDDEEFWNNLMTMVGNGEQFPPSTSYNDDMLQQNFFDDAWPYDVDNADLSAMEDYINDPNIADRSQTGTQPITIGQSEFATTQLQQQIEQPQLILPEFDSTHDPLLSPFEPSMIPPTPGTSLTNAINDLNFLSPSVFTAGNQDPFALAFSRTPTPQPPPATSQVPISRAQDSSSQRPQTPISAIKKSSSKRSSSAPRRRLEQAGEPPTRTSSLRSTRGRTMPTQPSLDRPHQCAVCHKSFARAEHRSRHMRVHTGEKPFTCVHCNKAFGRSDNLFAHLRTHEQPRMIYGPPPSAPPERPLPPVPSSSVVPSQPHQAAHLRPLLSRPPSQTGSFREHQQQ